MGCANPACEHSVEYHHRCTGPCLYLDCRCGGFAAPFMPTPENINALSEPLRRYIHDLETRCDPAGDVQTIAALKENVEALTLALQEHEAEVRALMEKVREACAMAFWPPNQAANITRTEAQDIVRALDLDALLKGGG